MGVIVTEKIELDNGMSTNSYYASINTNELRGGKYTFPKKTSTTDTVTGMVTETRIPTTMFSVTTCLTMWVSKEARDANKHPIQTVDIAIQQETPFTGNLYELLYAKYKKDHPNSVDA